MLNGELEDKLHHAKDALDKASSAELIELCKQYLTLLDEYRGTLYKLVGAVDIKVQFGSSPAAEAERKRKEVRAAIENSRRQCYYLGRG